jgi:hypothetical protein
MLLSRLLLVQVCLLVTLFLITSQIPSIADDEGRTLAKNVKEILSTKCFKCHGKNGVASKDIFVLDRARLLLEKTVIPGEPKSLLLEMVFSGEMPLGGPELSEVEKNSLKEWVMKGAPDWDEKLQAPKKFLTEYTVRMLILQDLENARERTRPFLRYFTIAHLYNAGASDTELQEYREGLFKLINSLSWNREIVVPQQIDKAGTLFRIDLRDYSWTTSVWESIISAYPYGVRTPGLEAIASITGSRLPYIRADWFVAAASVPPLYHDLLGLPKSVQELEKLLGVNSSRNLEEEKNVVRAGVRNSGVSQYNRTVERHVSVYGAYWKSFDFRSNLGNQNIFNDPLKLNPAGGEIIFNLPNGLQAYFLSDAAGRRIDVAPIDIVSDRNYPFDPVIRNGRSCMSCHFAGMKSIKDDVREVVQSQLNTNYDREKALALYAPQEVLDRFVDEDIDRFRKAVEKSGCKVAAGFQNEQINALSQKFKAELNVKDAASEAGLESEEFVDRLRRSRRLDSIGYGQLLVTNGGFKRDLWEKHFGDLVNELQLGQIISGDVAIRRVPAINSNQNSNQDVFLSFQKIFIHSRTVFLKPELLENELRGLPEFQTGKLSLVKNRIVADLIIELDRPLFTFTFTFTVKNPKTSVVLESGKVTAFDGAEAAPKIAREIMSRVRFARNQ